MLKVSGTFHLNADHFGAHGHHLAHRAAQGQHFAGNRRGNFHRGLIGHHIGQDLVLGHHVTDLHMPGDQLDFCNAFADIRHLDYVNTHHASIARLNASATRLGPGK